MKIITLTMSFLFLLVGNVSMAQKIQMVPTYPGLSADRELKFYVGHTNGGLAAIFSTVMAQALEERGWKVDLKVIGNCVQVKNLMATSDSPILATWGANWNDASNLCNLPVQENNFIDILIDSPRLMCGPVGEVDMKLQPGKTYRVGVNAGQYHDVTLKEISSETGINFKVIEYQNSAYIMKAMQAKEIDLWYTNKGLVEHRNGSQKCFYGTFNQDTNGITALNKVINNDRAYASFMAYLFVNDRVTDQQKTQLSMDVKNIIKSVAYQDALAKGGNLVPTGSKIEKIKMTQRNSRSYHKPNEAK